MSVAEIKKYWAEDAPEIERSVSSAAAILLSAETDLKDIRSLLSWRKPHKAISAAWARATTGRELTRTITDAALSKIQLEDALRATAQDHADTLLNQQAAEQPDIREQLEDLSGQDRAAQHLKLKTGELQSRAQRMMDIVDRASTEVGEAIDMEVMDMIGNNAFTTLLSHGETTEARDHLGLVTQEIQEFGRYLQSLDKSHGVAGALFNSKALADTAEWDLWAGVSGLGVVSFFTSYQSHGQLQEAQGQLGDIRAKINPILIVANRRVAEVEGVINDLDDVKVTLQQGAALHYELPELFLKYSPQPHRVDQGASVTLSGQELSARS